MVEINLTTLSGWEDLSDGTHSITVGATAQGYERVKQSTSVSVTKQSTYTITAYVDYGSYSGDYEITSIGTATVYITPYGGYTYPSQLDVSVNNANYYYNDSTGEITLSNPTGPVTIHAVCEPAATYPIYSSVSHGYCSGPSYIAAGDHVSMYIMPDSGYTFPYSVYVNGAHFGYDERTGEIYLYDATGPVDIYGQCEPTSVTANWVKFEDSSNFSLKSRTSGTAIWDGAMEYSVDATNWYTWTGNEIYSDNSHSFSGNYELYLRGTGNTYCSSLAGGSGAPAIQFKFTSASHLEVSGNIECLLDYQSVSHGSHPAASSYAFNSLFYQQNIYDARYLTLGLDVLSAGVYYGMFRQCTSLIRPPQITGTTVAGSNPMGHLFNGCSSLDTLPGLSVTNIQYTFATSMFNGCSNIKMSSSYSSTYRNEWRIPMSGTATSSVTSVGSKMFASTGGSFTGVPSINTTYYTSNDVI